MRPEYRSRRINERRNEFAVKKLASARPDVQSRLNAIELGDVFDSLLDFVLPVFLDGLVDDSVVLLEVAMDRDQ